MTTSFVLPYGVVLAIDAAAGTRERDRKEGDTGMLPIEGQPLSRVSGVYSPRKASAGTRMRSVTSRDAPSLSHTASLSARRRRVPRSSIVLGRGSL